MEICSVRHASYHFTVYPERKELAAYISDLEANNPSRQVYSRVYDDACDEGFVIMSERTGKAAVFHQDGELLTGDGELEATYLRPTRDTLRKMPQLAGWKVTVIND